MEDVVGQRRNEDLEVHPERCDQPDHDNAEQHERRVADVSSALCQVLEDASDRCRSGDWFYLSELAVTHREIGGDDRDVAYAVEEERDRDVERADQQARDSRPDDPRGVELGRVEPDGVRHVLAADHLDGEGLAGRHVDRVVDAEENRQDQDVPDLDDAGHGQPEEDEREDHRHGLCREERLAFRQLVGDDATEQAENDDRPELGDRHQAEPQRIVRQLKDEPGLGDLLHPCPDERDELAAEEEPVVAVTEGADAVKPADGAGWVRHRRGSWAWGAGSAPASISARWFSRWVRRA